MECHAPIDSVVSTIQFTCIIPEKTRARLVEYPASLQAGNALAGKRLRENMADIELTTLTKAEFLGAILNIWLSQIFTVGAVAGDGSGWKLPAIGTFGDISIAVPAHDL